MQPPDQPATPSDSLTSPTVLVVDDDDYVRDLIGDYLRARGVGVVEAENGIEALAKFRMVRPQAVVLDILMPRLGGLRTLQRIRTSDQSITVVVVTGAMDTELRKQVLASGATAILTKPIHLKDLWAALGGPEGLPEGPAEAPPPASVAAPEVEGPAAGKILVVDDEEEVRTLLEQFVSKQGHHARTAADGAGALMAITENQPDVILLDINMPRLSGVEALTVIHAIAPGIKVIMMSGGASFEQARETLAHGAFDFIAKPVDLKALAHTVQAALMMKQLEAEWPVEPERLA